MSLIVALIIIFLLFGGGGFYGYRRGYYGGRGYGGGLIFTILVILLLFWALSGAHAATTDVAVAPLYNIIQPYLIELFGILMTIFMGWGLTILQTHTNIKVTQQAKDAVQQAAMNAAGRIFATVGDKLAPITVNTHSELIAAEVPKIVESIPDMLKKSGMTPQDTQVRLQNLIAGKLGQLQATAAIPLPVAPVMQKAV